MSLLSPSSTNFSHNQLIHLNPIGKKAVFVICLILCCTSLVGPATALLIGLAVAQLTGHPYLHLNHKATHLLLQFSVVGLGFGMNVHSAMQAGKQGILFTVASILSTLVFGYLIGRWLRIEKKTSHLIATGTAICGGSAIAAIAPVIKAEEKQISVALGCIFLLNSLALLLFPVLGHAFHLSQTQFGLWCALAIHDTSSVVGAASKYGTHALEVATTVKLARSLWIIPVALISTVLFKNNMRKISIPYFIVFFILAMLSNTYLRDMPAISPYLVDAAKIGLTVTLFLIGAGLSRKVLAAVGFKPLLQGVVLWMLISSLSLYAVIHLI